MVKMVLLEEMDVMECLEFKGHYGLQENVVQQGDHRAHQVYREQGDYNWTTRTSRASRAKERRGDLHKVGKELMSHDCRYRATLCWPGWRNFFRS